MAELHLNVTDEERDLLEDFLRQRLKEKRVEEHRTDSPAYREIVVHQEQLIEGLLEKLGHAAMA
jgi:hypothetical protein